MNNLLTEGFGRLACKLILSGDITLDAIKYYQEKLNDKTYWVEEKYKMLSSKYPNFLVQKTLLVDSRLFGFYQSYLNLKKIKTEILRDKVLTLFVKRAYLKVFEPAMVEDALATIQTEYCINDLQDFLEKNAQGKQAYNFSLPDMNGKVVSLHDFKGKVVFIDFWFNGCTGCAEYYASVLDKTEENFRDDNRVVFISINADSNKQKWLDGINDKKYKYTSERVINLYTDGKGNDHPIIKNYQVGAFPRPLVIDKEGKIFSNNYQDLRKGGVEGLSKVICNALAK